MRCDHPDCTGVHTHMRPYAEWCPVTKQRSLDNQTRGLSGERHRYINRRGERRRADERDLETLRRIRGNSQVGR